MKLRFTLLSFLYLLSCYAMAQAGLQTGRHNLSGYVTDQDGALPDILIDLLSAADSALVKTELSDEQGKFLFSDIPAGKYRLFFNSMNHLNTFSEVIDLFENKELVANKLEQHAIHLKEVVVAQKRPYIERGQGKTILNIEGSFSASGSSAFEILEKAPGIVMSSNETIIMRGRQGIMVQIDGKNLPMSGQDLANYLRGLPSESIEKIELITNPSARYEAAGSAMINIKLKKDKRQGTNGSISLSYGQGRYAKTNDAITFNHRRKKINLFGNYSYAYREFFSDLQLNRTFFRDGDFDGRYRQRNYFLYPFKNHVGRLGLDYTINDRNSLGLVINGVRNSYDLRGSNYTDVFDQPQEVSSVFQTQNRSDNLWANFESNVNYKHVLDTAGTELTLDLDYARYNNFSDQLFTTGYFGLNGGPLADPYILSGDIDGHLRIYSIKSDFRLVIYPNCPVVC